MQEIQEMQFRSLGGKGPDVLIFFNIKIFSYFYLFYICYVLHFIFCCLENPTDREAWWAVVHRVAKSQTNWSDLAHMHSDWGEVIPHCCFFFFSSHCSFDLHFSNNKRCWASFYVFNGSLYVFFDWGEKAQEGEEIYIYIIKTDWYWCIAETTTTL